MSTSDKVAIVTGAGSGFGAGIARRLAQDGMNVVVADINEEAAKTIAGSIGGVPVHVDVSEKDSVDAMSAAALEVYGRVDLLVNNAGITHRNQPMLDVPESTFDRIFAVNVKAIYLTALAVVPVFRRQNGGAIINIASAAALRPRPGLVWYSATKGAVITMSKAMAIELASDGIRVNTICPVAGDTPLLGAFMGEDTPERREQFRSSIPLGRFCQPRDVAEAVLFLSSDNAQFITGVALEVDGGRAI